MYGRQCCVIMMEEKRAEKKPLTPRNNLTYSERFIIFLPINLQDSSPKCMREAQSTTNVQFLSIAWATPFVDNVTFYEKTFIK